MLSLLPSFLNLLLDSRQNLFIIIAVRLFIKHNIGLSTISLIKDIVVFPKQIHCWYVTVPLPEDYNVYKDIYDVNWGKQYFFKLECQNTHVTF